VSSHARRPKPAAEHAGGHLEHHAVVGVEREGAVDGGGRLLRAGELRQAERAADLVAGVVGLVDEGAVDVAEGLLEAAHTLEGKAGQVVGVPAVGGGAHRGLGGLPRGLVAAGAEAGAGEQHQRVGVRRHGAEGGAGLAFGGLVAAQVERDPGALAVPLCDLRWRHGARV